MRKPLSPMQEHAVRVLHTAPDTPVDDLLCAVGVRGGEDNHARFILRLLRSGAVRVTVTAPLDP